MKGDRGGFYRCGGEVLPAPRLALLLLLPPHGRNGGSRSRSRAEMGITHGDPGNVAPRAAPTEATERDGPQGGQITTI